MTTLSEALAPRSDQLNADDLLSGPRVFKLTGGRVSSEGREKKLVLSYEGDNGKPWKPCKTMGRAMVMVWALTDEGFAQQIAGKQVRLYRDPEVRFGDQGEVGGIRISHMSHIDKPVSIKLTVSQGKKSIFTFHPLPTAAAKPIDLEAAQKWADDHLGFVAGSMTTERLAEVQELGNAAMAKLAGTELHGKVTAAYAARLADITADFDPDAGRADEQHGDQFDGQAE